MDSDNSYDPENQDTYFYIDDWGMAMTKPLWDGDDGQERDSILRTAMAYKAWGDIELVYSARTCVLWSHDDKGEFFKAYRHPDNRDDDMSRDHILGLLLIEKFAGNQDMLKRYGKNFRWKISEKFNFTIDLWAFMKILARKWWWWPVFITSSYFSMLFNLCKNTLIYRRGKFSEEVHQFNWYPQWAVKNRTEIQLRLVPKLHPTYAIKNFAWQLYVLPQNVFVRGLRKISLKMIGRYNYLVRLLLGDTTVTETDIKYYRQMTSWRWGTTLNETCRRHVEIVKAPGMNDANRLEEDLLKKIWEERNGK